VLEVRVWDLPVRAVHWVQAALVATSVTTGLAGGNALRIHRLSGYAILALVVFRILWGFAGGRHARFGAFLRGPRAVAAFVRETLALRRPLYVGHNPLAGWEVLALLAVLLVQASSGLFSNDDIFFEGPLAGLVSKALSDALTRVHRTGAVVLLVLVAAHLAAAVFHLALERRNLVKPMLTGRARWPAGLEAPDAGPWRPWLAAALLLVAVLVVTLVVNVPGLVRAGGGEP
jgi:cytochrome b